MGRIETNQIEYENFGRCVRITNNIVELLVPLQVGPRIIKYAFLGEDNVLFEDINRLVSEDLSTYDEYSDDKWFLYGGHRLWMSPEYMPSSYYPDNGDVTYEEIENGIVVYGPREESNNVQKILTIILKEDSSEVSITNEILNLGEEEKTIAPWAITTLAKNGVSITPICNEKTAFTPNKVFAYWPYTKLNDKRMEFIEKKYLKITQDTCNYDAFKIGINNDCGWSAYQIDDTIFFKTFDDKYSQPKDYSDYGVNFEVYTKELFLELESLGKLKTISKGEKVILNEKWFLRKDDNKDIVDQIENALKNIEI
ncbi:hypothetical protein CHL78_013220 [Romboutsia weinsteinii]|uniref:DUF4380 domain-containing protein n=1 Tax=Romboutsia weinsteinii TaxID=2020949 RepID=A0A371J134_9FIRM|nr:hypothetical protein [Romboutsia weinsteinii]RDY26522.1 hypothetical protein CHL78_013220 [Romboutsia weinsteinii]